MDLEKFHDYSAQRLVEIRRHFGQASQTFDEEAIHQMRVEIKRLKALFQLLEDLTATFAAKENLLPIRPLYKTAGKIRDLQVQAGLAREWMAESGSQAGLNAFCQHLASLERQSQASFKEECQNFDASALEAMEKSVAGSVSRLCADQARRRAESLLAGLQSQLLERGQASRPEDNLHPLRILAKRTRHTAELLQMCLSSPEPASQTADAVRDIEQALGQWHDQEVALRFAGSFQEESGPSAACRDYMECSRAKKRELRAVFLEMLPRLCDLLEHPTRSPDSATRRETH